jgi:hypothetical protein
MPVIDYYSGYPPAQETPTQYPPGQSSFGQAEELPNAVPGAYEPQPAGQDFSAKIPNPMLPVRSDALPGPYETTLAPAEETNFRQWVKDNKVPFNPAAPPQAEDYDMRGFYRAYMKGDPKAVTGINPVDHKLHFGDYWKKPTHPTFSQESQWAKPGMAPEWHGETLVDRSGKVVPIPVEE